MQPLLLNPIEEKKRNGTFEMIYLDTGLGQAGLDGETFAGGHARIVSLLELFLQLVQLFSAEGGPIASELLMLLLLLLLMLLLMMLMLMMVR